MKNQIKNFSQFINESEFPDEMGAMRYLKGMGMLQPEQEIEQVAKELSQRFGVELVQTYSSFEDNNPDEEFGEFINWGPAEGQLPEELEELVVQIYEGGKVQFWFDATPYPTRHHSREEARQMLSFLNPAPVAWEKFDREDWKEFIGALLEEYGLSENDSEE